VITRYRVIIGRAEEPKILINDNWFPALGFAQFGVTCGIAD